MKQTPIHLIGYASGLAGVDVRCGDGPLKLQAALSNQNYVWDAMIKPSNIAAHSIEQAVKQLSESLAAEVSQSLREKHRVVVLGGDHSSAIGTWSGVYDAMHTQGDVGLIWIDAHMDSHTPDTTHSGRIHGMPMACLLGYGYKALTHVLHAAPKLKPSNVCLIGVRSFEPEEAAFLKKLNVKVYFMDEVKQRGFAAVFEEAKAQVKRQTVGYGVSLDLDGIDLNDAPGVDVPEPNGIRAAEIHQALSSLASDPRFLLTEIVEFDPSRDYDGRTEKLILSFIEQMAIGKKA